MLNKITRGNAELMSVVIGLILLFIAFYHPRFFFFNPLETEFHILGFAQIFAITAWFLLTFGPVLILLSKVQFDGIWWALFLVAVIAWPASVIIIRVILLIQFSNAHFDYLVKDPVFIFSDILVPLAYLLIARRLKSIVEQEKAALDMEPDIVSLARRNGDSL
jgi:hypothetical protein